MSPMLTAARIDNSSLRIKSLIRHALRSCRMSSLQRLEIEVDGGTVTIRGTLRSFYERQVCLARIQRIPHVVKLVDNMKVEWP